MKTFIIALLFIAGTAMSQELKGIDKCVPVLHSGLELVNKLALDFESKNTMAVLKHISQAQPIFSQFKENCQDIELAEVAGYVYTNMTQMQRNCLTEVLSIFFVGQEVVEDVKLQNWNSVIADLKQVEQLVAGGVATCKGAFTRP